MSRWDYYGYYKPSRPKAVKSGIKAAAQRGQMASTWWGKRWLQVLESFNLGARLSRGRSYARSGQVLSIDIDDGLVSAKVQGSRSTPYKISIKIKSFTDKQRDELARNLASQAVFAAKLLAGEMPDGLETIFMEAGCSLFPEKYKDLDTDCSCPDWSNPCKHIAAVYYIIGEEFDRDPFLIFKLRGIERDEFMTLI
jgi:uncharacterized Zn finger protein